jgi:hypothetical protein
MRGGHRRVNKFVSCLNEIRRSIAAEAVTFFHDKKVTKKSISRKASLPHGPLPCKAGRTTGWENLPLASPLPPHASAKIPYALPAAQPTTFCPLSPEA